MDNATAAAIQIIKVGPTTFVVYPNSDAPSITFSVRGSRLTVGPYGAGMSRGFRAVVLGMVQAGRFEVSK